MSDSDSLVSAYLFGAERDCVLCFESLDELIHCAFFVVRKFVVLVQAKHVLNRAAGLLEYDRGVVSILSVPSIPLLHVFVNHEFQYGCVNDAVWRVLLIFRAEILISEHALLEWLA